MYDYMPHAYTTANSLVWNIIRCPPPPRISGGSGRVEFHFPLPTSAPPLKVHTPSLLFFFFLCYLLLELLQFLRNDPDGVLGFRVVEVRPPRITLVLLPGTLGQEELWGRREWSCD